MLGGVGLAKKHGVKKFGATAKRKNFVDGQVLGWRLAMRARLRTFEDVSRRFKYDARCVPSVKRIGREPVQEGIFEKGLKTGCFFFLVPEEFAGCACSVCRSFPSRIRVKFSKRVFCAFTTHSARVRVHNGVDGVGSKHTQGVQKFAPHL